jgi:uncharacterized membrane protein YsdA (DUF1294 family)
MKLVPPYVAWNQAACPQGEPLTWLGYDGGAGEHWFGVGAGPELCGGCWEATRCPRQFAHQPAEHETLLGRLPLASRAARGVLYQVRPWIEPAQSFEKNQLGLSNNFDSFAAVWVAAFSAVSFLTFGFDKWRASRSGQRVSELALEMLGALGGLAARGWPGGLLGMIVFRHKTSKWTFKYALTLIPFFAEVWAWLHWRADYY